MGQWQIIFFTTAGVFLFGMIVYTLLGSGEEQSWNHAFDHKADVEKQKMNGAQPQLEMEQDVLNKRVDDQQAAENSSGNR